MLASNPSRNPVHPNIVGGGKHEKQGTWRQRDLHLGVVYHEQLVQPKRGLHWIQFVLLSVDMLQDKVSRSTK